MLPLLVGLLIALLIVLVAYLLVRRQRRRPTITPATDETLPAGSARLLWKGEEIDYDRRPTLRERTRLAWDDLWSGLGRPVSREPRGRSGLWTLLLLLIAVPLVVLAIILVPLIVTPADDHFTIIVAPFRDAGGAVGQTGRSAAAELAALLDGDARLSASTIGEPPADADAALAALRQSGADVLLWGDIAPGGLIDQESLTLSMAYLPSGAFAPYAWDGYVGRFSMPTVYSLSSAPVNGRAVLQPLLGAMADYGAGHFDAADVALQQLLSDAPALAQQLPRALRGNILWARGDYGEAAAEYRRIGGIGAPDDQLPQAALLANNLGAILQDEGTGAEREAFTLAVQLLGDRDLGELRFNLARLALRDGQPREAVAMIEQARNLLPQSAPLLLTIAESYRQIGEVERAREELDRATSQIADDAGRTVSELRDLTTRRLRADILAERGRLGLVATLGAQGPLRWELLAATQSDIAGLGNGRAELEQAVRETEGLGQAWARRSVAQDASARSVNARVATEQSRRAERRLRDLQLDLAATDIELARLRTVRRSSGIAGALDALFGGRSPAAQSRRRLEPLLEVRSNDYEAQLWIGRSYWVAGQPDEALERYGIVARAEPRWPEPVYGEALVALDDAGQLPQGVDLLRQAILRDAAFFPARLKLAEVAAAQGDWPTAVEQRRWLWQTRPSEENRLELARTLRRSGEAGYAEAEALLLEAANRDDAAALLELSQLYRQAGKPDLVLVTLQRAQRAEPRNAQVAVQLGTELAQAGQIEQAEEQFRLALDTDPALYQAHIGLAQIYGVTNRQEAATREYRAALADNVTGAEQLRAIGDELLKSGEVDTAITAFDRATKDDNADVATRAAAYHDLGRANLRKGRVAAARNAANEAIRLRGGTFPEAFVTLGDVELRAKLPDDAQRAYEQALVQNPALATAYVGLGRVAYARSTPTVARAYFEKARELDPDSPEALYWVGQSLTASHDYAAAADFHQQALDQARQRNQDYPEASLGLAEAQWRLGQADEAEENLRQALQERPRFPEAFLLEGEIRERQGRDREALESYTKAIAANDELSGAYLSRARVNLRLDDLAAARRDLQRVIGLAEDSAEAHYWLGRTYLVERRSDRARDEFRRAVELTAGSFAEARFYQGVAEEQLGLRDDAVQSLRDALALDRSAVWVSEAEAALRRLGGQ